MEPVLLKPAQLQLSPIRERERRSRINVPFLLGAAIFVAGLGASAKVVDHLPGIGDLLSYLGPWVVVTAMIGRRAENPQTAGAAGFAALVCGVVAYYAVSATTVGLPKEVAGLWLALAAVAGPGIGLFGYFAAGGVKPTSTVAVAILLGILGGEAMFELLRSGNSIVIAFDMMAFGVFAWQYRPSPRLSLVAISLGTLAPIALMGVFRLWAP